MTRAFARLLATALIVAVGWLSVLAPRAMGQPTLSHVTPGAAGPGKTTELTLHGAKLDGNVRVWSSFPAQIEVVVGDPKQKDRAEVTCKLTLASGVPIGIGGIVVATADGSTDVAYLMIDDLSSIGDSGNNHLATAPQEVSLPVAVDGQCEGTLFDYYRFSAKAGEQVSCEVVATRLGADFDPLVRVLDDKGNELLLADDDPSSGADPRFVFTAPASGQYLIELRDNRYKPGGRYRLRLGDFPLVSTPLPLVVQRGTPTHVGFRGPWAETATSLAVLPLGLAAAGRSSGLDLKPPGRQSSGWATIGVTDLPVFVGGSKGDRSTNATSITLPCVVSGAIDRAGDRDLFQFQAKKGTPLRFRAITRSTGSPAILALRLRDAGGKQLAESPVTDSDEPALSFSPPADGTFQLAVEELAGRGGSDFTYAVECRTGPQFALLLKNDKNNRLRYSLPSGGAFTLDVQCQRAGYDGPITLGIESPRSGWQLINNVIAAKANEGRLYIVPPVDLSAAEMSELRIVGRAEVGGQEITSSMSTTIQLRAARPQTPYPPGWHDGAIFVSGLGSKLSFYTIASTQSNVTLPRQAGQTQFKLDFERTDSKFKDVPLTVVPLGLPSGVTAEVKRNGNGPKETYEITLKGSKDLSDGEHMFRYFAYAEMSGQGRGVVSGDIQLKIVAGDPPPAAETKTP
jgi:Bacterial pre-peptidase C-terminal domain